MIVAVASGKGGTGKTSVAVNIALSVGNIQILDCDVEEPNAHLLLHPKSLRAEPVASLVPLIDAKLCDHCGKCAKFCQYNALFTSPEKILVFPELCHSCGGCAIICPKKAITWKKNQIGVLHFGNIGSLTLVYGELEVGKPMVVPVIKAVKKRMEKGRDVILDSPPGASCPFVETVRGSDFCVLVTEPTPFGLHDLKIAVQVLKNMTVPFGVVINRAGVGDKKVYDYCRKEKINIMMEIPYQRRIAELYSRGIPFCTEMPEWTAMFQTLYDKVKASVV
jgi:MinD superfamily P-loop ATPase